MGEHRIASFFQRFEKKKKRNVLGLMSGTSMDGVDVSLCQIQEGDSGGLPKVIQRAFHSFEYRPELKQRLQSLSSARIQDVAELHMLLGNFFGEVCLILLRDRGLNWGEVDLIGSHGQTVYHHSSTEQAERCTLQLGDGDRIAVRCGVPVISDFRSKDICLGGEGAPLTPYADKVLFGSQRHAAILNIGGIANISYIDSQSGEISGYDTGPGNAPLDRLARIISEGALECDKDGAIALQGSPSNEFIESLIQSDKYLKKDPPKSTGFEMYGDEFLNNVIVRFGRADKDLMATLTTYVAKTIIDSIKTFSPYKVARLIVSGGGARNPALIGALQKESGGMEVIVSDDLGISADAREAICFALLAHDVVLGKEVTLPAVTGATRGSLAGKFSFPW